VTRPCAAAAGALAALAACQRPPPPPPPAPPAAALVDGQAIALKTVQRELDRLRRGPTSEAAAPVESREVPELARALLGSLVDRTLLVRKARAAGLAVSDAEVQREVERLSAAAQAAGHAFEERLKNDGQTAEGLAEEIRERLLAGKWVAREASKPERPGRPETKAWYDAHRAELDVPEAVRAFQIVVSSAEQAKSLLDQIRAGALFEALAKKHSESPDGKRGGDLGWFARGTMPKVFDDVCFSLKIGALSGVVASPYGYHLFKVAERRPAARRAFEEVKGEIERRILAERRMAAERKLLEGLRAEARVEIDEAQLARLR